MADNMSANIVIKSLISGVVNNASKLSGLKNCAPFVSAMISHNLLLSGAAFGGPFLIANVSINLAKYDDPIDYLMFENSVRMRTEADIYIKTEGSV
jgi:hypothetical protein|tara:strand:- start:145 stop:432 length:288 start_codon:yes stop_codon:yes gene_type:complete